MAEKTTRAPKTGTTKKTGSQKTAPTKRAAGDAPKASARSRPKATQIAGLAGEQLLTLTGRDVEGVTGLERSEDGWKVQVEVVEVRRIPDTTDVLALYEVQVDEDGDLESYRRLRRYTRGAPGEE